MLNTRDFNCSNRYVNAMESILASSRRPVQWLVITHSDPRLVKSVTSLFADRSAVILEEPQDRWDGEASDLAEMLEFALRLGNIKNLVLVGSSQSTEATSRAFIVNDEGYQSSQSSYEQMLSNMKAHQLLAKQNQDKFASLIQKLTRIPAVHDRWSTGQLALHALFYRPETGVYLYYDANTNAFELVGG